MSDLLDVTNKTVKEIEGINSSKLNEKRIS